MPIPVQCPGCRARLNAPDAARGRNVKCPKCQTLIAIPAPTAAASDFEFVDEPAPAKKPAAPARKSGVAPAPAKRPAPVKSDIQIDDDEDDRPRKRKYRDDDDDHDDRPRKKGKKKASGPPAGLLIGIAVAAVLVLGGGGFAVYWFAIREKPKDTVAAGTNDGGGPKATAPDKWVSYSPPTGGFKVYFPGNGRGGFGVPTGPVRFATTVHYSGENEDDRIQCQVDKIYFPPEMSATDREKYIVDKLDPSKEKLKAMSGIKEVSRGDSTLGGAKATQVVLELDLKELMKDAPPQLRKDTDDKGRPLPKKVVIVARGFVSNDRGYIVSIITGDDRSSHEKAFFDNFELTPETAAADTNPTPKGGPIVPKKNQPKP